MYADLIYIDPFESSSVALYEGRIGVVNGRLVGSNELAEWAIANTKVFPDSDGATQPPVNPKKDPEQWLFEYAEAATSYGHYVVVFPSGEFDDPDSDQLRALKAKRMLDRVAKALAEAPGE